MNHEPTEDPPRRWIWVFGEVAGLRWVVENQQMAFPPASGARARRIRAGDQAVLYTSRGAFHNPTRDEARLAGLATVTGGCEPSETIEIAAREFTWACPITVDVLLPERQGPSVRALASQLELVKRPEAWGGYFRSSPIEVNEHDWRVLIDAIDRWQQTHATAQPGPLPPSPREDGQPGKG